MTFQTRGLCLAVTLGMVAMAAPACAQENLDQGKSAQQLFASDCAICHKSAQGLAARAGGGGLFGLDGFLREHYTTSRQTASMMAKYLQSVGDAPAADSRRGASRRSAKPSEGKPSEKKPGDGRKSEAKSQTKPEQKPEQKPDAKPEAKPEAEKPAKSE